MFFFTVTNHRIFFFVTKTQQELIWFWKPHSCSVFQALLSSYSTLNFFILDVIDLFVTGMYYQDKIYAVLFERKRFLLKKEYYIFQDIYLCLEKINILPIEIWHFFKIILNLSLQLTQKRNIRMNSPRSSCPNLITFWSHLACKSYNEFCVFQKKKKININYNFLLDIQIGAFLSLNIPPPSFRI